MRAAERGVGAVVRLLRHEIAPRAFIDVDELAANASLHGGTWLANHDALITFQRDELIRAARQMRRWRSSATRLHQQACRGR